MKVRSNLSVLVLAALLASTAAYGEDTVPGAETAPAETKTISQENSPPGEGLQIPEKDEPFDGSVPVTQSDIDGVRGEVQLLRDQWQKGLDRTVVQTTRLMAISGTGTFKYSKGNQFINDNQAAATPDSFSTPSIILNFNGNLYKDYLEVKNINYSLGLSTSDKGAISIQNANLTYSILNTLNLEGAQLSITGGQQKKTFGIEATAAEAFKPTVNGAQFTSKLGLDARDIGFVLAGDFFPTVDYGYNYRVPAVQYWFGLVNGTGANAAETNSSKDVFTRIQLNAPVNYDHLLRGLSLGVSYLTGKTDYTVTNTKSDTATFLNTSGTTSSVSTSSTTTNIIQAGTKERWGVDLAYVNTPIGFTLEYAHGQDLIPTNGSVATKNGANPVTKPYSFKDTSEEGYTFTLFYSFGDQFVNAAKNQERFDDYWPKTYQPFVRFDRWTPDTDFGGVHTDVWTAGFNWFFAATTKLQVNYNVTRDYKSDGGVYDSDAFLAQFQFGF